MSKIYAGDLLSKNKLFLITILAAFVVSGFTVVTANAAQPFPQTMVLSGHISMSDQTYFPGTPEPLGRSSMLKLVGRITSFSQGPITFQSIEDAVIDMTSGVGTTHGRVSILIAGLPAPLEAQSNGKVYPELTTGGLATGFSGQIATIGKGNNAYHATGTYQGHFLPTAYLNGIPIAGDFYIRMDLKVN